MAGPFSRSALVLCLACLACLAASVQAAAPPVVRAEAELKSALASRQPTPLDALTPYGKRTLLQSMRWNDRDWMLGFSYTYPVRELDQHQLAALLAFLDSSYLMDHFRGSVTGAPLRLPGLSGDWNAAHPMLPMGVPTGLDGWRAINGGGVPRFFVLRDGKVLGQASGWPEEGNQAAVLALLDAARK